MVDKYGTGEDPACYPGTSTLRNLLNIKDPSKLEEAERDISFHSAQEVEFSPPPYDLDYLCYLHKRLFQDIYAWAGDIRTIDISKGHTRFCTASRLRPEASKLFTTLAEQHFFEGMSRAHLVFSIAELYGEVNMLHPFREGNGRAQRLLFEHLIVNAGYEVSWAPARRQTWLEANVAAVQCDYRPLTAIFDRCIGTAL
ncbi:putative adenosine monophosphate-protein transferase Fic [Gilvimarinus algae]|uniref:protein adenylyltransferase n=1 Tax=Gilvimarinus algae TaxID=3058037 RepID=A0ABT8TGS4_9GAMM|nr:putative adenosine monophosphate-protein transferase Fic [Gilvimarinus sp. SDUM040014]MDO3383297.1 putative adenosine monophosphate-protein transferase Fic [Gilvimarinus sp. SDUM040014]